jgi:hypothetical protein
MCGADSQTTNEFTIYFNITYNRYLKQAVRSNPRVRSDRASRRESVRRHRRLLSACLETECWYFVVFQAPAIAVLKQQTSAGFMFVSRIHLCIIIFWDPNSGGLSHFESCFD